MFVNKIPILASVSRNIHYSTATVLRSAKAEELYLGITEIMKQYEYRGMKVTTILVDKQFECVGSRFPGVDVNVVSRDEHVPEIERLIRVIKERCRCYFSAMPFKKIPHRMCVELVHTVIFYLNAFPWINGPEKTLSPFTIVQGKHLNFNKHFQVKFSEYTQTYKGTDNIMKP